MIPKRAILIASGSSVRQNQWDVDLSNLELWNTLQDEFTIGMNWSYKYIKSTVLMFNDYQFYSTHKNDLNKIPLILGREDNYYNRENATKIENNVILLKPCERVKSEGIRPHYWGKEAWTKGWFCSQLIGLKALNLAIALNCDEIYLLGYDACDINGHTHFYEDDKTSGSYMWETQKHCGMGKHSNGLYRTGNYNKIEELNSVYFAPFKEELNKGIKIYNVSLNSKINTFPKISYEEFYKTINDNKIRANHKEIQEEIKRNFNEKRKL